MLEVWSRRDALLPPSHAKGGAAADTREAGPRGWLLCGRWHPPGACAPTLFLRKEVKICVAARASRRSFRGGDPHACLLQRLVQAFREHCGIRAVAMDTQA